MSRSKAGRCRCTRKGKRRFRDHREATEALKRAAAARSVARADGVTTTHRATRAYECERCRGWHLTSWATQTERVLVGT